MTTVAQRGKPGRNCPDCGELSIPEGPDPCLGLLPGVSHACCGHGDTQQAYVVLGGEQDQLYPEIDRALTLRGADALEFFDLCHRGAANPLYPGDVKLP